MALTLHCAGKSHALPWTCWNWGLGHGAQESMFNIPGGADTGGPERTQWLLNASVYQNLEE